jgi:hypothetical protein
MFTKGFLKTALFSTFVAASVFTAGAGFAADTHTTAKFSGVRVNDGTATHARQGGADTLTWSADFKLPDSPAPHWQVVDSRGNVFLLQRLKIKEDKLNRTITLPAYVRDVAKVQIYCSWAEALLGEASFAQTVVTAAGEQPLVAGATPRN